MLEPASSGARQRMAADEREARRQRPRRGDDLALRAAGVGDDGGFAHVLVELLQQRDVLPDRRGEHDEIGFGQDDEIVRGDVDRVQPHRRFEDVLVVHGDHQRRRPQLARLERDRPANQPQADDPDLLEDRRRALTPGRLQNWSSFISDFDF